MANTTLVNPQGSALPQGDDVVVGCIKGAWGLHGDLKVEPLTDFSDRFSPGSLLMVEGQAVCVERSRSIKGGLLVKLDLVKDRTRAESLRGRFLTVSEDQIRPLPEGSYYHFQIIGIGVWSEQGEYLGDVKEILTTGSNDVYVVRRKGRKELLIPALEGVVLEVNLGENRTIVRLPEGL